MLILTRRPGQSIVISDDIEIVIQEVRGQQVKLGIKAPKHITVDRKEVAQRKRNNNARP